MSLAAFSSLWKRAIASCLALVALPLCVGTGLCQDSWLEAELPYRLKLEAASGNNRRKRMLVAAAIDWQKVLQENGIEWNVSRLSFKLYRLKDDEAKAAPCDYVYGRLVWRLSGVMRPLSTRTYCLYFATAEGEPKEAVGNVLGPGDRPPGVNLVDNGDFEAKPGNGSPSPPLWQATDKAFEPGKEVSLAPGEGADGSTAIRLKTRLVGKRHRAGCESKFFPVKPGVRYFGGGKVKMLRSEKGLDGSGCAVIGLQFYKADKTRDWRQRKFAGAKFVSGQWEDLSKKIGMVAPRDTGWARAYLHVGWYGPAEAVFDDITIVEMPKGGLVEVEVGRLEKKDRRTQ